MVRGGCGITGWRYSVEYDYEDDLDTLITRPMMMTDKMIIIMTKLIIMVIMNVGEEAVRGLRIHYK